MGKVNFDGFVRGCQAASKEGREFIHAYGEYEYDLSFAQKNFGLDSNDVVVKSIDRAIGKLRAIEKASGIEFIDGYLSREEAEEFFDEIRVFSKGA